MKITVLGATGVVGRALLPASLSDHELVAVSRSRTRQSKASVGSRATGSADDVAGGEGAEVVYYLVHLSGGVTSSGRIESRRRMSRRRASTRA